MQHHAPLSKQDIAHINSNPKLRFAAVQLLRTYDSKQRLKILAQFSVNEQLALLAVCAKKRYNHRILTKHNYKKLTQQEKALIQQLLLLNTQLSKIAQQLNRHISTVHYYIKRLLYNKSMYFFKNLKHSVICYLFSIRDYKTLKEFAAIIKLKYVTVQRIISTKHSSYSKRQYNKLTNAEKALIQQLLLLNTQLSKIAQQLHRNVSTVYYYVKRLKASKEPSFFFSKP